jgi:hypothetical protein
MEQSAEAGLLRQSSAQPFTRHTSPTKTDGVRRNPTRAMAARLLGIHARLRSVEGNARPPRHRARHGTSVARLGTADARPVCRDDVLPTAPEESAKATRASLTTAARSAGLHVVPASLPVLQISERCVESELVGRLRRRRQSAAAALTQTIRPAIARGPLASSVGVTPRTKPTAAERTQVAWVQPQRRRLQRP